MVHALMNRKFKLLRNQKGLTLVELLAVIVILGVIAAIAVPAIGGVINNSKINSDAQTELLLSDTAIRYLTDIAPNGPTQATVDVATLVTAGYLREAPVKQSGAEASQTYTTISVAYTAATGWTSDGTFTFTP